jgi:hypothetical protein
MPMNMPMDMPMDMSMATTGAAAHGGGTSAPPASWSRYASRWGRALGLELLALTVFLGWRRLRRPCPRLG